MLLSRKTKNTSTNSSKTTQRSELELDLSRMMRGTWNPPKMSELLNEQHNSVFSTLDPTMIIKYPNDFFGHPQANTLLDINIRREDIIDAIKTLTKLFWRP